MKKIIVAATLVISIIFLTAYLIPQSNAQKDLYLTGKVVLDGSNKPVSSIWVELFRTNKRVARSLTGDDGRYYISGLGAGQYEIVVRKSNREFFRHQLQINSSQTFDITL